jgi:hypothetical protein
MADTRLPGCYGDEDSFLSDETDELEDFECTRCPYYKDCEEEVNYKASREEEKKEAVEIPQRTDRLRRLFGRGPQDRPNRPPPPPPRSFSGIRERTRVREPPPPPPPRKPRRQYAREEQPSLEIRQTPDGAVNSVAFINGVMRRHEETRIHSLTPSKAERFVRRTVTGGLRGMFFEAFEFFCDEEV